MTDFYKAQLEVMDDPIAKEKLKEVIEELQKK